MQGQYLCQNHKFNIFILLFLLKMSGLAEVVNALA